MGFDSRTKEKIKKVVSSYPSRESAILPCLHLIQREYGHLRDAHFIELSKEIDVPSDYIYSTATFYTMFNLEPVGKYHIQVCRNISCSLLGAGHMIDHICKKLKIEPGQTTRDGKFTLSLVECLGACGAAPVMMVNKEYHENLDENRIDAILEGCK